MHKRILITALVTATFVVALVMSGAAQTMPNLAGTWMRDAGKSDPLPPGAGGGFRFGRGGNPNQMVISKTATQITVSLNGADYIYNLDGSERTGPPGGETKSTIKFQDGKLVVTWHREFFAGPDKGYITSHGVDTYSVSGNVLTVEKMSQVPPAGPKTVKTVYNKVS
jgi:hypothetical protein